MHTAVSVFSRLLSDSFSSISVFLFAFFSCSVSRTFACVRTCKRYLCDFFIFFNDQNRLLFFSVCIRWIRIAHRKEEKKIYVKLNWKETRQKKNRGDARERENRDLHLDSFTIHSIATVKNSTAKIASKTVASIRFCTNFIGKCKRFSILVHPHLVYSVSLRSFQLINYYLFFTIFVTFFLLVSKPNLVEICVQNVDFHLKPETEQWHIVNAIRFTSSNKFHINPELNRFCYNFCATYSVPLPQLSFAHRVHFSCRMRSAESHRRIGK